MAEERKMALVLATDEYERIHAASLMASVAAMSGIPVQVYVTMEAMKYFRKDGEPFPLKAVGEKIHEKKAPTALDLLRQGKELGDLKVHACAMVLDLFDWKEEDLSDLFDDTIGVAAFLNMTEGSQIIFV